MANKDIKFYNVTKTLSLYSDKVLMYMVIGARGVGKSYSTKKHFLNRYFKTGERFFYARRYADDIQVAVRGFFDKVVADNPKWQKYEFREKGLPIGEFQYREKMPDNGDEEQHNTNKWQTIGWYGPLSMFNRIKSIEYTNVKKILYDEFLIEANSNQRYLKNEPILLINLYDSIARLSADVKLILMANATSIYNPFFEAFGIDPDMTKEYGLYKDDSILVHFAPDKVRDIDDGSAFSRLVKGTEYEDYALNNNFTNNTQDFVRPLKTTSIFKWSIILEGKIYGIWKERNEPIFIISDKYNNTGVTLALTWEDAHEADYTSPKAQAYTRLIANAKDNRLYFSSPVIREKFRGPINKLIGSIQGM